MNLVELAVNAMSKNVKDGDFKIQIVDEGALELIIMAEPIQEQAVALLYNLCIQDNILKMAC